MPAALPELLIRPIRPADAELLDAGLKALSPQSVYQRFLTPKPRFTQRELRYLTEVDGVTHHALVALDAADPSRLVAVGRWIRLPEDPESAEIAIVVGDCWQGQGVGRRLGLELADAACRLGVRRFTATMLAENTAARRLLGIVQDRLAARPCAERLPEPQPALAA